MHFPLEAQKSQDFVRLSSYDIKIQCTAKFGFDGIFLVFSSINMPSL